MDSNSSTIINSEQDTIKGRRGITGSTLKLIAIFTMLIDHTAASILDRILLARGMRNLDFSNTQAVRNFISNNAILYNTDHIMRMIGRIAFPIFCFLLVEGFLHTRNTWKYASRLALFALISEIPFDLAFVGKVFYFEYQNVYFTLLIGLLVMIGFKAVTEKGRDKKWLPGLAIIGAIELGGAVTYAFDGLIKQLNSTAHGFDSKTTTVIIFVSFLVFSAISLIVYGLMHHGKAQSTASVRFADIAVLIAGMTLAEFLMTDYSGFGVLTIAVMYGLRRKHFKAMLGGCTILTMMSFGEFPAFLDLIFIRLYNGKRGLRLKYVFYLFYPVHLFLLYLICYFMKLT